MARPISVVEVTPGEKRTGASGASLDDIRARLSAGAHRLMRSAGVRQQEVATRLGVSDRA